MEALLQVAGYAAAVAAAAVIVVGIEALNDRGGPSSRLVLPPDVAPHGMRALLARLRQRRS
jgi:hypothetical protein